MAVRIELDKRSLVRTRRELEKRRRRLTNRRNKIEALKAAAQPVLDKAKSLVRVRTGAMRRSLEIVVRGESVFIASDDPGAVSSEYLDTPYMRPALKGKSGEAERRAANKYKRLL
ncbi:HK97 gp10 family phage protein [Neptunomonas sp.]|uniref:HK97 gp10 family phage protein n=1 Tax=Neptunomonas sp. TaxID=1971898 RepID=UPI003569BF68